MATLRSRTSLTMLVSMLLGLKSLAFRKDGPLHPPVLDIRATAREAAESNGSENLTALPAKPTNASAHLNSLVLNTSAFAERAANNHRIGHLASASAKLSQTSDDSFPDDDFFQRRRRPFDDSFSDDDFFQRRRRPFDDSFSDDDFFQRRRRPFDEDDFFDRRRRSSGSFSDDGFGSGHHGLFLVPTILFMFFPFCIFLPCCICCCVGYHRSMKLRAKLDGLKLQHPEGGPRIPAAGLPDGFARLNQETRIMVKEKVNAAQELTGHLLNYSVQTANNFEVHSVTNETLGEHILSCREAQDLQAMIGMNLGGALQAAGIEQAGHFAGRDKAPFRISIGLPPENATNLMSVTCPAGVPPGGRVQFVAVDGRQLEAQVPQGVSPGMNFQVVVPPSVPTQEPGQAQQVLQCLVPGAEANNDVPFLYLERPFAFDCLCINRPHVEVFHVAGGQKTKIGIITDPFACIDMTFNLHMGANASEDSTPDLCVKGPGCQPGANCQLCGLCCGARRCREAYLEVTDPKAPDSEATVAFITKGWAGGMQELFTSANSFYIDFGKVKEPQYKAMLLATTIFINYRFFEGKAGQQRKSD